MKKIFCATTNPGKLREFRLIVNHASGGAIEVEPLPGMEAVPVHEETGQTFEENAIQKATYYGRFTGGWLFADDSGLEVEALGGEPGIHSARFAGPQAIDESNNRLLLERMDGVENRSARFVCAVALVDGGRLDRVFHGAVEGQVLHEPRGENGFGYDPLFYYPPFGCSFGEVDAGRKLSVSHRGQALAAMTRYLLNLESKAD